MTCSISDKWRSCRTDYGNDIVYGPQVTQFQVEPEEHQPEIREQSLVVVAPSFVSQEKTPKSEIDRERTPFKTVFSSINKTETEEDKLVSLCLMAMNLEGLEWDDTEIHDSFGIEPLEMTLLSSECTAKRFFRSMDLEDIGSLSIDYSQERPKLTVKDSISGLCHSGFLKAVEPSGSRKEIARLNHTVESMTKVIQMLTSQIGVLEERVRMMEGCDTVTMKE